MPCAGVKADRFSTVSVTAHRQPMEAVTDRARALATAIDELIPAVFQSMRRHEGNRLKARLRPMRGLKPTGPRAS